MFLSLYPSLGNVIDGGVGRSAVVVLFSAAASVPGSGGKLGILGSFDKMSPMPLDPAGVFPPGKPGRVGREAWMLFVPWFIMESMLDLKSSVMLISMRNGSCTVSATGCHLYLVTASHG